MAPASTSLGDQIQLFQLPEQKTVLWDHTACGHSYTLHLSCHQKPKVYIKEKVLQWASSQLESQPDGRMFCQLFGSLTACGGPSSVGISVMLNQYESCRVPNSLCTDEIIVPVVLSRKTKGDYQWDIEQYFSDLKAIHMCCSSMVSLNLNQFLKLRIACSFYGIQCDVRIEMAAIGTSFTATPIAPVFILQNELSESLSKSKDFSSHSGFLTMDHEKHIVLLPEIEPHLSKIPLVGIWVSGVSSVLHPIVWAACVRYISSLLYKKRLCLPPLPFLLVTYHPDTYQPTFYDCICDSGNTWPIFACYEGNAYTDLPKVPVLDSKLLFIDLMQIDERCKEFDEADKRIERNKIQTSPSVITSNTEDVPQASYKAPQNLEIFIDPVPQVPDLSFASDTGSDYVGPALNTKVSKALSDNHSTAEMLQTFQHIPGNAIAPKLQLTNKEPYFIDGINCNNKNNNNNNNKNYEFSRENLPVLNCCVLNGPSNVSTESQNKSVAVTSRCCHLDCEYLRGNMIHQNHKGCLRDNVGSSSNNHAALQTQNENQSCPSSMKSMNEFGSSGNFCSINQVLCNGSHAHLNHLPTCDEATHLKTVEQEINNNPYFKASCTSRIKTSFPKAHNQIRHSEVQLPANGRSEEFPRQRPIPFEISATALVRASLSDNTVVLNDCPSSEVVSVTKPQSVPMKSCLKKTSTKHAKFSEQNSSHNSESVDIISKCNTDKATPFNKSLNGPSAQTVERCESMKAVLPQASIKPRAKIPVRVKNYVPSKTKSIAVSQASSLNADEIVEMIKTQNEVLHTVQDQILQLLQQQNAVSGDSNRSSGKKTLKGLGTVSQKLELKTVTKAQSDLPKKHAPMKSNITANKNSSKQDLSVKRTQETNVTDSKNVMETLQQQHMQLQMLKNQISQIMGKQENANVGIAFQEQQNHINKESDPVCPPSKDFPSCSSTPNTMHKSLPPINLSIVEENEKSCQNVASNTVKSGRLSKRTCSIATMTSFVSAERVQNELGETCTRSCEHTVGHCESKNSKNGIKVFPEENYAELSNEKCEPICHSPVYDEHKEHNMTKKSDILAPKSSNNSLHSLKYNFSHDDCLSMPLQQDVPNHSLEPPINVDMEDYPDSTYSEVSQTDCDAETNNLRGNFHDKCSSNPFEVDESTEKTVYRNILGNVNRILSKQEQTESAAQHSHPSRKIVARGLEHNGRHSEHSENNSIYPDAQVQERKQINRRHICRNGTEQISIVQQSCVITTKNCNCSCDQGDFNARLNALTSHYLSDEDIIPYHNLNHRIKYPSARELGCSELTYYGMTSSSLSFATKRYLENYELIPGEHLRRHAVDERERHFCEIEHSHPLEADGGIWVFDKKHRSPLSHDFINETACKKYA